MSPEALKLEIQKTREHLTSLKQNIADWEAHLATREKLLADLEAGKGARVILPPTI